jgi:hypothetical protein
VELLGITVQRLMIALLVALLAGLVVRLAGWVENRYWEWRYPLAGEYLAWFDGWDASSDEPTRTTVRWRQFGTSLNGKSSSVDGSAQWTQESQIREGNVIGVYTLDNPHDDDIGTFFLRIKRDGRLSGYWAGQDAHGTATLRAGEFELIPRNRNTETMSVTQDTLPVATTIDNWRLSVADPAETIQAAVSETGDDTTEWLSVLGYSATRSPGVLQRIAGRVLDARPLGRGWSDSQQDRQGRRQREYTGLAVASVRNPGAVADRLGVEQGSLPDPVSYAPTVGLVELIGLDAGTHGRVVAIELLERMIERCRAAGATVICLPVTHEDEILADVVARLQFEPVGTVGSTATASATAAAVVGDGGENRDTTLYLRFE